MIAYHATSVQFYARSLTRPRVLRNAGTSFHFSSSSLTGCLKKSSSVSSSICCPIRGAIYKIFQALAIDEKWQNRDFIARIQCKISYNLGGRITKRHRLVQKKVFSVTPGCSTTPLAVRLVGEKIDRAQKNCTRTAEGPRG